MAQSKVMALIKKELLEMQEKMLPQERIKAFFIHSQLLTKLLEAGKRYQSRASLDKRKL